MSVCSRVPSFSSVAIQCNPQVIVQLPTSVACPLHLDLTYPIVTAPRCMCEH
ncbi:hypothetical protein Plhal304r1_c003g0010151 [Plasmopara halstedii]